MTVRRAFWLAMTMAMLGAPLAALAGDQTLLTPDGVIFEVRSGLYGTLDPTGTAADPQSYVIEWSRTSQQGIVTSGIIPGTDNSDVKEDFDLAYDSLSDSLFLVWSDQVLGLESIQFAVYHEGLWQNATLLPSNVFTFAANPTLAITHETVQTLDANGNEVDSPRSIVSVVWWENGVRPRARFAPIFIENGSVDLADIQIYDMPELVGSATISYDQAIPNPYYEYPSVQQDGLTSDVLITFGDLNTGRIQTAQVEFPSDFRHTNGGRHVIVILSHKDVGMTDAFANVVPANPIQTIVGGGYNPTLYWQSDDATLSYTIYRNGSWSDTHAIAVTPERPLGAAVALLRSMAAQD